MTIERKHFDARLDRVERMLAAISKHKSGGKTIAGSKVSLETIMPNGKKVRDLNKHEAAKFGREFSALGKVLTRVSEAMDPPVSDSVKIGTLARA